MNRPKLRINSEELFGNPDRPKFGSIREDEFTPTEIGFLVENLKRRGDFEIDRKILKETSVPVLIDFLSDLEEELTDAGKLIALLIRVKLKNS